MSPNDEYAFEPSRSRPSGAGSIDVERITVETSEIKERVDSFERWHYRFDLDGVLTPIWDESRINRHEQRRKYLFDPLKAVFGGSLKGKRVLDVGCNAGFWSLAAIEAGCDYVLGLDGRQMHVDQANFVFEVKGVPRERYLFVTGDIFKADLLEHGHFDVVLCLGFLYHVSKHLNLLEIMSEVNKDILLIDTTLSLAPGSKLVMRRERLESPRDAVDYELAMTPTRKAVEDMVSVFGYRVAMLRPRFSDYAGCRDFREGRRRAFVCAKATDLRRVALDTEPIRSRVNLGDVTGGTRRYFRRGVGKLSRRAGRR
jgi:2-polyprenyl-3-methyl-5-hydroxy-6-metoxy-1,4-benzoquinol methylase